MGYGSSGQGVISINGSNGNLVYASTTGGATAYAGVFNGGMGNQFFAPHVTGVVPNTCVVWWDVPAAIGGIQINGVELLNVTIGTGAVDLSQIRIGCTQSGGS